MPYSKRKKPIVIDLSTPSPPSSPPPQPPPQPPPPPPQQQQQQQEQQQQEQQQQRQRKRTKCEKCNSIHVKLHKDGRKAGTAECHNCLYRWQWLPQPSSANVDQDGVQLPTTSAAPAPMEQVIIDDRVDDRVDDDQDESRIKAEFDKRIFDWMDGIITTTLPEDTDTIMGQEKETTPPEATNFVVPPRKIPVSAMLHDKDETEASPPVAAIHHHEKDETEASPVASHREASPPLLNKSTPPPPPPPQASRRPAPPPAEPAAAAKKSRHATLDIHKTSEGSSESLAPPSTPKTLYIPPRRPRVQYYQDYKDHNQQREALAYYTSLMQQASQSQLPDPSTIRPPLPYSYFSALLDPTKPQLTLIPPPPLQQQKSATTTTTRPSFSPYVPRRQDHDDKEQRQPTVMPP